MAKNFASLAFTDAVKEMQEKMGSRRVMPAWSGKLILMG